MNDSHGRAANAAGTKQRSSSICLSLIVGLALLLPGTAALAIGEPIPGIDIVVKKNPGGTRVSVPMGAVSTTRGMKIAENNSPLPTTRGIHVAAGDVNGDGVETRKTGEPIPGVDIYLGKNPGGIMASSKTDNQGAFHFDKLPAGNYTLKLSGRPEQSLTIGADGIAGGKVMRGSDGKMSIFDRWGNSFTNDVSIRKAAETPIEFGSGNTMGSGPSMGPGMSPGAGPDMGSAMGPSAGRP